MRLYKYAMGCVFLVALAQQPLALGNDAQGAANQELALMQQRLADMEAQLAAVQQVGYQAPEQYEESYMEPNEYVPQGEYMPAPGGEYYGDEYGGYAGEGCYGGGCYGDGCGDSYGCGGGCCGTCGDGGYGCGWGGEPGCGCGYEPSCGYEPGCGAGYGNGAGYGSCPRRPGCVFMAEAVFLRPQDSVAFQSKTDYDAGSRYLLGYTNGRGQSIRGRYFQYEADDVGASNSLEIEMADLEFAADFSLGRNWTGEIGGGVRWAKFDNDNTFDYQYFDSVGPVLGAELRANPWPFLAFIVGIRQSLQFGHPYEQSGSSTNRLDLGSFGITEMELGLEWQGCLCGGQSFLRGTVEAQQYEGVVDDGYEDQRLIGFGVALGIRR